MLIACLLPLLYVTPSYAQQQPNPIQIEIQAGYEGRYRSSYWFPVVITVSNAGPDISATIGWVFPGQFESPIYQTSLDLPQGARKRIVMSVLTNEFSRVGEVRVLEGSSVRATQQTQLTPVDSSEFMLGVISSDVTLLNSLSAMSLNGLNATNVVHLSPDQLPEQSLALGAINALVLHDSSIAETTAAQQQALREWVRRGGQLVIGGGANADRTTAGLEDLLPVRLGVLQSDTDLDSLRRLANRADAPPATTVSQVDVLPESRRVDAAGIITERTVGDGRVFFAAFDLAALRVWQGEPSLWAQVFDITPIFSPATMFRSQGGNPLRSGLRLPGLSIPPFGVIVLFIIGYIALIGPVSYYTLRRIKRADLLWVVIPAIVVVFLAGTYGVGSLVRGNRPLVVQFSVVQGNITQDTGASTAFVGIFSPNRATYTVGFTGEALISRANFEPFEAGFRGNEPIVMQNGTTELQNVLADVSSLRTFMVEQGGTALPKVQGTFQRGARNVTGEIVNTSGQQLDHAMLVVGDSVQILGDIPANGRQTFDLETRTGNFPDQAGVGSDGILDRQSILYTLFSNNQFAFAGPVNPNGIVVSGFPDTNGVYLLFWREDPALAVQVDGLPSEQNALTLYIIRLND